MNQPLEIKFDYPLATSDITVALRAIAILHHSDPYYIVDHFHLDNSKTKKKDISIMPPQEIKRIKGTSGHAWVHRDSERESLLSMAMGKAIDQALKDQKK